MDPQSRKSNKIRDIVRLQQILKKWKKLANTNKTSSAAAAAAAATTTTTTTKSIKFLKKTLSFSDNSISSLSSSVPKGSVAVCVGRELKRFVIPTEYLSHHVFGILLREAEEEFGFQQEGVLRFPCEVDMFEKILKMMEDKRSFSSPSLVMMHDHDDDLDMIIGCSDGYSPESELGASQLHHPQMCR